MSFIPNWYLDSIFPEGEERLFTTGRKLPDKVDSSGFLKPFFGETTVFLLPDGLKDAIIESQNRLYEKAGDMLCVQRLSRDSLHMTLHDLWNEGERETRPAPAYSHEQVCRVLESICRDYPDGVRLRVICTMNMVNTSVVMGLIPASEPDGWSLSDMYSRLDELHPLGYGLTPHITLAYYRPGVYTEEKWSRLKEAFEVTGYSFALSAEALHFQRFYDMERYETVF